MWSEEIFRLCSQYTHNAPNDVVYKEPYLPYIPTPWNRILVLAEAQNLSSPDGEYNRILESLPPQKKITRLGLPEFKNLGVGPWDNGVVKLALKSMSKEIKIEETGVGNAVPWSCRQGPNKNANPTKKMKEKAVEFWKSLLELWQPDFIAVVPLGKVAQKVTRNSGFENCLPLRLPSPNAIRRVCGMFNLDDLLERYPEVTEAKAALGMDDASLEKVFYACHAVSLGGKKMREFFDGK